MTIPKAYEKYEQTVSIACINFASVWGDKPANLAKITNFISEAAAQGNNIIIFPELALSGYECDEEGVKNHKPCSMHEKAAETIPGPSTIEVAKLVKELKVYVVLGMPEQDTADPKVRYNSAAVIGPEGILGVYRKLHLGSPPLRTESVCFKAGSELPIFETRYGPIGVLICYDYWFQPELARLLALKGARVIINSAGSSYGEGKQRFMLQQTGARASENLVYSASANLVGKERTLSFYGHGCIAGPLFPNPSYIFAEGGETEEIVAAKLSFAELHRSWEMLPWRAERQAQLISDEFLKLLQ